MAVLYIGLDDTDSRQGMCTTYVAALILERLGSLGVRALDFPHLIRLNPNCPYKTRGNAAISFIVDVDEDMLDRVKETVLKTVEENYERGFEDTQPGIAFLKSPSIPARLVEFGLKAVREMVTLGEALEVANEVNVELHG